MGYEILPILTGYFNFLVYLIGIELGTHIGTKFKYNNFNRLVYMLNFNYFYELFFLTYDNVHFQHFGNNVSTVQNCNYI